MTHQVLPEKISTNSKKLLNSVLASILPLKKPTDYLNDDIEEIESEEQTISKQLFRDAMVAHRAPFTREEMHLISKLVEKDNTGSLSCSRL